MCVYIYVSKCRTHCTERIWIDHFKGSSRVCSIMWLLAANPPLRVQALFPKSIHDLFRFFLTNWLKCQKEGQRTRKAENPHVEEASVWYVRFTNDLKQLTELENCHSFNLALLQGWSSRGSVVFHGWLNPAFWDFLNTCSETMAIV